MNIQSQYETISRCNRCGFCQVACPVFRATGHEAGVARGRVALLKALIENRMSWDEGLKEPLFDCLSCGACTANCFPAVATADLVLDARAEYLDRVGRNHIHRLLFRRLLPHPRRLRLAARAAALARKAGLSRLASMLGLLRVFGRDASRAEQIVHHFPDHTFRGKFAPGVLDGEGDVRIGYFVGCGTDVMEPNAAEAALKTLRRMGKTVEILDNCCCGLPAMTYGDRTAAQALAEKNLHLVNAGRFDLVVTDCSSCAAFLKKYPALFGENDLRTAAARALAERVRDFVQILSSDGRSAQAAAVGKTIATYHDPCHASRGQGLVREPRTLLRSLPGVEFREMPEADWCCGGAGSYAVSHYDLALKVLDRKIDNLERTGANLLVTSCPACIVHLRYGIRLRGLPVRVCHIAELVAPAPATSDPNQPIV
jgi:glycolate oxidase iron-sulfur subunit